MDDGPLLDACDTLVYISKVAGVKVVQQVVRVQFDVEAALRRHSAA
jgi:hypothetical protein